MKFDSMKHLAASVLYLLFAIPNTSIAKRLTIWQCPAYPAAFACGIKTPNPDKNTADALGDRLSEYNRSFPKNAGVAGDTITICNAKICADYEILSDGTYYGANIKPQTSVGVPFSPNGGHGGPGNNPPAGEWRVRYGGYVNVGPKSKAP